MTLLKSGTSAMVNSAKSTLPYGSPARSLIQSGAAYMLVQVGLPADLHKGATVQSAKLRVYQVGAWTGSRTLTVQRIAARWLVSKVTWGNKPGVTGTTVAVTQTGGADGAVWEFDVTAHLQLIVDGAANYGWRISTSDATGRNLNGYAAAKFKPVLDVTYTYAPPKPTNLNPSAGAVSASNPTLTYDSSGVTVQRIQIDPAANGTTPAFDSGEVATDVEEYSTSGTAYPGLALNATTQWRVMVRNASGVASPWSAWATFTRTAKPVLTVSQPPATVADATPPFTFAMAGIKRSQVLVYDPDDSRKVLHDSGERADTVGGYTPPTDVFTDEGKTYTYRVRAWDGVVRDATAGDPTYSQVTGTTTVSYDNTITAVTGLVVAQVQPAPWPVLTWSRTAQPDGWVIQRDGAKVAGTDTATDYAAGVNAYTWTDYTASPNRPHTYKVLPVVNGATGKSSPSAVFTSTGAGLWLADPATGDAVVVWGDESGDWSYGEDGTTLLPIGGTAPVQITSSLRGLEGSLSGVLTTVPGAPSVPTLEAVLFRFKGDPAKVLRLVAGDVNIPVNVFALGLFPDPRSRADDRVVNVQFSFAQVGELPFKAVI